MKNLTAFIILTLFTGSLSAQRLPAGMYQPNRERAYDLLHLRADLSIDWATKGVQGEATIRLRPLVTASMIDLDAYRLRVSSVRDVARKKPLTFSSSDSSLTIDMGRTVTAADTVVLSIRYSAVPTAGMYFVEARPETNNRPAIFTYGEGGIHANWLPLYNDLNDKFSTELVITVAQPHTALSNGRLVTVKENADGTRTFHWSQDLPHSNYLIALFVGEYSAVPLRNASGTVPLTVWVHPGREEQARMVFQRTPDMVEYFSGLFQFRYPWEKYDQVAAFDYAVGAMENTSLTGHNDLILRDPGQTTEFRPLHDHYASNWTVESIIAHELAHHWYGNNTTCRSLANIWMNESFASYLMMLWDEHRLGNDELQSHTWFALQAYLRFVRESRVIRPLEYRYFDTREQIFNTETTYQKGAIVLHMLRWVLGDRDFFAALALFQQTHQFASVESIDFLRTIEDATGRNVEWFFEQWVWGGGHPVFEVTSSYLPLQKKIQVVLEQVQPLVEGQGVFALPVEIRIDVKGTSRRFLVWVRSQTEHFLFDAPHPPDLVSIDGRGWLVADVRFRKRLGELVYQVNHDDLSGRFRALQQMTSFYASDPAVTATIRFILESGAHWSLRAEAALQLRSIQTTEAEALLVRSLSSPEYHVRKAAAIALGSRYTDAARSALRGVIADEVVDDVAAAAIVSLARIDGSLSPEFLRTQIRKPSWYHTRAIAALKAIEILAADHQIPTIDRFVPTVSGFAGHPHHSTLRQQALKTWAACAPADTKLHERLMTAAAGEILPVRTTAIGLLASLNVERALPVLGQVARQDGDSDIRHAAQEAIDQIQRVLITR